MKGKTHWQARPVWRIFFAGVERGACVTEFLILAPALVVLVFITMDINEGLLLRHTMQLSIRNSGFLVSNDAAESVARDFSAEKTDGQENVVENTHYKFQIQESLDNSDAHDKRLSFFDDDSSPGNQIYSTLSEAESTVVSPLVGFMNGIKNFSIAGNELLIADMVKEVSLEIKTKEATAWQRINGQLLSLAEREAVDANEFNLFTKGIYFVRNEAGYHPNDYRFAGFLGYALGWGAQQKHWAHPARRKKTESEGFSKRRSFTSQCIMHFMANNDCSRTNPLSGLLWTTYVAVGLLKAIPVLGQVAWGIGKGIKIAANKAIDVAVEEVEGEIKEEIEGKVSDLVGRSIEEMQIGRHLENIKTSMEQSLTNDLQQKMEGHLD